MQKLNDVHVHVILLFLSNCKINVYFWLWKDQGRRRPGNSCTCLISILIFVPLYASFSAFGVSDISLYGVALLESSGVGKKIVVYMYIVTVQSFVVNLRPCARLKVNDIVQ